jgi:glycosyltransferase involved in cell wall biosynthesis
VNQGGILRPVAAIARRLRIPILCQVQTLEDARWVSGLESCHPNVASFVCNSQFVAAQCHVPKDRLSTIYYGYKPKGLRREWAASRGTPSRVAVGLLGRICESKGHYLVIEVARRMKAAGLPPIHFRFVGEAPTGEERAKVRGLVESAGLTDWIDFRGYQANLAEEFGAKDILVVPSQAEPFGRVFCEAAEAGVPVLLADSGGLGELSRRFQCGERFQAGDVDDFVIQLTRMAADPGQCRHEFQPGAARMLSSLDMTKYLAVMKDLIHRSAQGLPVSVTWLGEPCPERGTDD